MRAELARIDRSIFIWSIFRTALSVDAETGIVTTSSAECRHENQHYAQGPSLDEARYRQWEYGGVREVTRVNGNAASKSVLEKETQWHHCHDYLSAIQYMGQH